MAFLVEDGTGVAGANSYDTVANADTYFNDRRVRNWQGSTEDKQAALIQATDYIEQLYGLRFKGCPEFEVQTLSFPRTDLYDVNGVLVEGIPLKLKFALYEYALCARLGTLFINPTIDPSGLQKTKGLIQVGPIRIEDEFAENSAVDPVRSIPAADSYMQDFITGSQSRVIRA